MNDFSYRVVILNWNQWKSTVKVVQALIRVGIPAKNVIVVDNASSDGSFEYLESALPNNIVLLQNRVNLGFGGGCNVGIEFSLQDERVKYVVLLNNDVTIRDNFVEPMIETSERTGAAIVGALILDVDGRPLFSKRLLPRHFFKSGNINVDNEGVWKTDYVDACCVLLRRDFLEARKQVTGEYIRESLFLYCEEPEFCSWASRKGFLVVATGKARIYHEGSASLGGSGNPIAYYYLTRNKYILASELFPPWLCMVFRFYFITSRVLIILRSLILGNWTIAAMIFRGIKDGLQMKLGKTIDPEVYRERAKNILC